MAALLVHGSGGSRARVAAHARMLARHGYGVLAIDLPGNGESDGHSNGLGDNAQPAITTALDYLQARPGVDRIVGYGVSMGGEVLLEAAARDARLARSSPTARRGPRTPTRRFRRAEWSAWSAASWLPPRARSPARAPRPRSRR